MINFKSQPIGSIFTGIFIVLLLIFSISGGIVTSSCNSGKTDTTAVMNIKCPDCPSAKILAADPVKITELYILELSELNYNTLKIAAGPGNASELVFQFLYDATNTLYPMTLIAYAARPGHHFKKRDNGQPDHPPHPLTYIELTAKSKATDLTLPPKFALGDQQVSIDNITELLKKAGNPTPFTLVFTPTLDDRINIKYAIDVYQGLNKITLTPIYTNPSPPANAD